MERGSKMSYKEEILSYSEEIKDELINIRRDLYMNPELSGKEFRTSKIVADKLKEYGIDVMTDVGGCGVIGTLKGKEDGRVIALRADMDALPMQDTIKTSYKSLNDGVKHGCGHDVHTTIALGTAKILSKMQDKIKGTIKFIFQPAEENTTGAKAMIKAGALKNPLVDTLFAFHVFPIPVGKIGLIEKEAYSACNSYLLRFSVDKNLLEDFNRFYEEFSKKLNSMNLMNYIDIENSQVDVIESINNQPVSFRAIDIKTKEFLAGNKKVLMCILNIKAANGRIIDNTINEIEALAKNLIEKNSLEVKYSITQKGEIPSVYNDPIVMKKAKKLITEIIGYENIVEIKKTIPFFVEDFAYYEKEVKENIYFLGIKNEAKGLYGNIHHSGFDVDEDCIAIGTEVMSYILLNYLELIR